MVPRIKCSRVRQAALAGVLETLKDHYSRVRDFGFELLKNNPKNTVDIRTSRITDDGENKFQRIYICYHALKEGWKMGCRPVLGLDGCFLKTVCGGQLLSAVGRDGNNNMYPIAYAVVEYENTQSWRWFLGLLKEDLSLGNGNGFTMISDQQKGLENAMKEYLPHAEHRLCTRHLYNNMRKLIDKGPVKKCFWMASCATYPAAYQRAMKALLRYLKPAYEHLMKLDPKSWSRAFFQTHCVADNVENNMSEFFNSWIVTERYMPLLNMLQEIHFKIMRRIRINKESVRGADIVICPRIKAKLDIAVKNSRKWHASWDGETKYMVKHGTRSVTVNLENRTCDCRAWDLTGIPCSHAVAAIHDSRHQPLSYVSPYYTKDMYLKSYSLSLQALRGEDFWEISDKAIMLPPDIPKKLRGRPKRLRRREHWEGGTQSRSKNNVVVPGLQKLTSGKKMHCSLCREAGHKKPKCPLNQQNMGETGQQNQGEGAQERQGESGQPKHGGSRAKLPVKRRGLPGIVIREQSDTAEGKEKEAPRTTKGKKKEAPQTSKGKEKVNLKSQTKRKDRPFWMVNKREKKSTVGMEEDNLDGGYEEILKDYDNIPDASYDDFFDGGNVTQARTTEDTSHEERTTEPNQKMPTFQEMLAGAI